jgi:hypothetical protein
MTIDLYVGPVTARSGSFGYDTFSQADGLRSSFRYKRVEQARYDQRTMIGEYRSDPNTQVQVWETVAEFERAVSAERNVPGDASAVPSSAE